MRRTDCAHFTPKLDSVVVTVLAHTHPSAPPWEVSPALQPQPRWVRPLPRRPSGGWAGARIRASGERASGSTCVRDARQPIRGRGAYSNLGRAAEGCAEWRLTGRGRGGGGGPARRREGGCEEGAAALGPARRCREGASGSGVWAGLARGPSGAGPR